MNEDIHKAEMKEVLSMPPINTTVCATANRPHPHERIIQNIHRSPVFFRVYTYPKRAKATINHDNPQLTALDTTLGMKRLLRGEYSPDLYAGISKWPISTGTG